MIYATQSSVKKEFWMQVDAKAGASFKNRSAVMQERSKHRGMTDIVWTTLPILLLTVAFIGLILADMYLGGGLQGMLGAMGHELNITVLSPEGRFMHILDYALIMAIPALIIGGRLGISIFKFPVDGLFKKIVNKVDNPSVSRGYKVIESSMLSARTAFYWTISLTMAISQFWMPLLMGSIACCVLFAAIYQKFYKGKESLNLAETLSSFPIPGMDAQNSTISYNKMIMYAAGAIVFCAGIAAIGILAPFAPPVFCVGLLVAAAIYGLFRGLNASHTVAKDEALVMRAHEKEMKEMEPLDGAPDAAPKRNASMHYAYQARPICTENPAEKQKILAAIQAGK
jgi:hypothetical protein